MFDFSFFFFLFGHCREAFVVTNNMYMYSFFGWLDTFYLIPGSEQALMWAARLAHWAEGMTGLGFFTWAPCQSPRSLSNCTRHLLAPFPCCFLISHNSPVTVVIMLILYLSGEFFTFDYQQTCCGNSFQEAQSWNEYDSDPGKINVLKQWSVYWAWCIDWVTNLQYRLICWTALCWEHFQFCNLLTCFSCMGMHKLFV